MSGGREAIVDQEKRRSVAVRGGLLAQLLASGKLTPAGAQRAERLAAESGERAEVVLARLGLVSERDIADAFSAWLGLPLATADEYPAAPILEDRLNRQ